MDTPEGRIDPIFPSRRHDREAYLEFEAIKESGSRIFARELQTAIEIVRFLEQWWSEEAVAPVRQRLAERFRLKWSDVPWREPYLRETATENAYPVEDIAASPGIQRGIRLGEALHGVIAALEIQDFVNDTMQTLDRGPVMARAEHEWGAVLNAGRAELMAISTDPDASPVGREVASAATRLLAALDDADDPTIASTWPVQRKNLIKSLLDNYMSVGPRYVIPPPDPPPPPLAAALYQEIVDYRFRPDYKPGGDDALRFAYADAIEPFDPARAVFVRRQFREQPGGEEEPPWFDEPSDDPSRFFDRIPGMPEPVPVAALSPMDVHRWVEPVGPHVLKLHWEYGFITAVSMTVTQLVEHGEQVMAAAPIVRLTLVNDGANAPATLDFLRTTSAFAPLRYLIVTTKQGFRDRDFLQALVSNPNLTRLLLLEVEGSNRTAREEMEAAAELTQYLAANPTRFSNTAFFPLFEGTEQLVVSRALEEARHFEWVHPNCSGYGGYERSQIHPKEWTAGS